MGIPKIIHYCWFGGNELPEQAKKCIESWKKYLPRYEIKEWNESNYSFNCCDYVREAAEEKKWAFVSDYARFDILYKYGGVYFDTDVELIREIDDIIAKGSFMGIEKPFSKPVRYMINPGLGMAAEPGMEIFRELLKVYQNSHYIDDLGEFNKKTVLDYTTELFSRYGFENTNKIQKVKGVIIYPDDYFCPVNYGSGQCIITENTRSIHHYSMSWKSDYEKNKKALERVCNNIFGIAIGYKIYLIISFPYKCFHKVYSILKKGTKT